MAGAQHPQPVWDIQLLIAPNGSFSLVGVGDVWICMDCSGFDSCFVLIFLSLIWRSSWNISNVLGINLTFPSGAQKCGGFQKNIKRWSDVPSLCQIQNRLSKFVLQGSNSLKLPIGARANITLPRGEPQGGFNQNFASAGWENWENIFSIEESLHGTNTANIS